MKRSGTREWVCCALALTWLGGCGDWFGKDVCEVGEQSCKGKQILTCAADVTAGQTKWQALGSCGITGPNLVCALVDGLAECVPAMSMDGGASSDGGEVAPKGAASGSRGTLFGQTSSSAGEGEAAAVEWARLDVQRTGDGSGYAIVDVTTTMLDFVPSSPAAGEVAAVGYAGSQLVDATMVAFQGQARMTTAWLRAPGVDRVALVASSGKVLAERVRQQNASTGANVVKAKRQTLSVSLPPTLKVIEGGMNLGPLAAVDAPTTTVVPTEEMLLLVANALNRLPSLGASTVTHVAFTNDDVSFAQLQKQLREAEVVNTAEGTPITVRGEADAGAAVAEATPPFPSTWFSERSRSSLSMFGQVLVVNVSEVMMAEYRADPSLLTLEILRHVGALFVQLNTPPRIPLYVGPVFFPKDFPAEVGNQILQKLTPLLLPMETFTSAWSQLHDVAVLTGLAGPYQPLGAMSDAQALDRGFAALLGAQGPGADFAEFVARGNVQEQWSPSPCPDIRGKPLDQVPPRRLVHLAKLEMIWGLGYMTTETLRACVGDLTQTEQPSAVRVYTLRDGGAGEVLTFGADTLGSKAPFMNEEVHVTVFGRREDDAGTQATMDASYRGLAGLFRIVPSDKRADPRLGAGFYLADPKNDFRSQALGGVLLITRADEERIEAHALMVYQTAPFLGFASPLNVWPLVTARYDIPKEQRELGDDSEIEDESL